MFRMPLSPITFSTKYIVGLYLIIEVGCKTYSLKSSLNNKYAIEMVSDITIFDAKVEKVIETNINFNFEECERICFFFNSKFSYK